MRAALPNAYSIRQPQIPGSLRSVFLTDEGNETYVYKFNHFEMGIKNVVVSTLMREQGIHVPNVCLLKQNGHYIEKYNIIPGKTLYEHIGAGMPDDKIRTIFYEAVDSFVKMSNINAAILECYPCARVDQIAKQNVSDVNGFIAAKLVSSAIRLANKCDTKDLGLYHTNITPKNIIVSPDGHLAGIIDMDEVALCDKNYAFASMAAKYQQLNFNIDELVDRYEQMSLQPLNRTKIAKIANLNNIVKNILWRLSQNKKTK